MPEGHTIHRAARDHEAAFAGQVVRVSSPQGRFDPGVLADGARLRGVEAYGKHLFYAFVAQRRRHEVHVHLGLFGKFRRRASPAPPPRDTVRMRLEGTRVTIDLAGPTACQRVTPKEKAAILARLGPDPLRADADPERFFARLARSKAPIGVALMDQSVVAGIGNVYRAELLHMLRLNPALPACDVPAETRRALWSLMVGLLRRGVEEKRIVTTRGLSPASPRLATACATSTHVYGQRACASCGASVVRYALRARTVHYCRTCQPLTGA